MKFVIGARYRYNMQKLRKARPELRLPEKSGRERSFGLAHCLDRASETGGKELIGGEGTDTRGRAIVRVGAELVMSWVSWAIRPTRVVLMACSKTFCHSVSSWR